MKPLKIVAVPILATLLAGATCHSHAQDTTLIAQQAYLKASNTGANDVFGYSVAISGDTVVVGARWEDSNATEVNGNQSNNTAGAAGAMTTLAGRPGSFGSANGTGNAARFDGPSGAAVDRAGNHSTTPSAK